MRLCDFCLGVDESVARRVVLLAADRYEDGLEREVLAKVEICEPCAQELRLDLEELFLAKRPTSAGNVESLTPTQAAQVTAVLKSQSPPKEIDRLPRGGDGDPIRSFFRSP